MSERFQDKLPADLVDDLRWVQTFIRDNGRRFDMEVWLEPNTVCGTVGCIAGHMACRSLSPQDLRSICEDVEEAKKEARKLLEDEKATWTEVKLLAWKARADALMNLVDTWRSKNIPEEFASNFDDLFVADYWPEEFKTTTGKVTPRLAIRRIDYFLETGR